MTKMWFGVCAVVLIIFSTGFVVRLYMKEKNPAPKCLATPFANSDGRLSEQFASTGIEVKKVYAGEFKNGYKDLRTVAHYNPVGDPSDKEYKLEQSVAWVDEKGARIIVDKKLFSDLNVVDATSIGTKNSSEPVGVAMQLPLNEWGGREIVFFLIESQIIETYWHTGATMCLTREENTEDKYVAHFDAMHTYFTNEENVEHYTFSVSINLKTGQIQLGP